MLVVVEASGQSVPHRVITRLLAGERPNDLGVVVGTFPGFALLNRVTQAMAAIGRADLDKGSLLGAAVSNRWWLYILVVAATGVCLVLRGRRLLARWIELEHGSALRKLAAALIVFLTWQSSLYDFNFVAGQNHGSDRIVVAVLALAAIYRPLFLVPFIVQARIINEQFRFPFTTPVAKNIDELLLIALLAMAVGHLVYVTTRRPETSPVLLLISAAVASHFFQSGLGKFDLGWYANTDLSNLPLNSYTTGWLGSTGGAYAQRLADLYDLAATPVMVLTIVLELGAIVAVLRPRLLQWWLPGWIAFHVFTFATTGFFFLGWMVLEVGLLIIVTGWQFRDCVGNNATPARALVVGLAVLAGPVLFDPPRLAWLDAPIAYGYQIEAVGESGTTYNVPISAFAPLDHQLAVAQLQLRPTSHASAEYGAITNAEELAALDAITTFEQLQRLEATLEPPTLVAESRAFMVDFFDHTNADEVVPWSAVGPPGRFWTSAPSIEFNFDEPLVRLEVVLVTTINGDEAPLMRRESVLVVERDAVGTGVIVADGTG